ncbi:MAG: hypothetical protein IJ808_07715 [Muribaculaceae bacterium]|nr:hypothetical protein [Muribaculaceae bacterium]
MEEKNNMTAERSLEIITEQIERSRRVVAKDTGQSLYVAGLCTMAMAVVVALVNYLTASPMGNLLWFLLPVIIWIALRDIYKERTHAPVNLVGTLVAKTWQTFAVFTLGFFVVVIIWYSRAHRLAASSESVVITQVPLSPVIVLFMSMAVTITGHILKNNWLVWFGVVGGLVIAICQFAGIDAWLLMASGASGAMIGVLRECFYCLFIFLLALVGLTIPGLMLKRQ